MKTRKSSSRQRPEQSSGIITIEDDRVIWHNEDLVFATFNLSNIVVIGEMTNSNGPWFDDWFLTFVLKDGNWFRIPWYADNIEGLTKILCDRFQSDLNISYLANSTNWNSIIRHPSSLKGINLFEFTSSTNSKEPKTFFEKILVAIGIFNFKTVKDISLSKEVKRELENVSR